MASTDMYAATEVSKILGTANESYKTLQKAMEVMDKNLVADMNVLWKNQMDTIAILGTLNETMENMVTILEKTTVKQSPKGKSLLFWGGVALLGYAVYKSTEPKKGNNRG